MSYTVHFQDKDDGEWKQTKPFPFRADAEETANRLKEQGHPSVTVQGGLERYNGNLIYLLLRIVGFAIYVLGGLGGLLLQSSGDGGFSIAGVLIYWFWAFVFGTLIIGLAEIVKLLDKIYRHLSSK